MKPRVAAILFVPFIRSPMEYGVLAWFPLLPTGRIQALEVMQNRFLRGALTDGIRVASAVVRWEMGTPSVYRRLCVRLVAGALRRVLALPVERLARRAKIRNLSSRSRWGMAVRGLLSDITGDDFTQLPPQHLAQHLPSGIDLLR